MPREESNRGRDTRDTYPRNSISSASMVSEHTRPSGNLMVAHNNWIRRPADKVLMGGKGGDEEGMSVMKRMCQWHRSRGCVNDFASCLLST